MQVGRAHTAMMDRRLVLGEVVTEVTVSGFTINEKLAFAGAVLDPIEAHFNGFGYFCFILPLAKPSAVELLARIGFSGYGCPSSVRVVRIGTSF